MDFECTIPMEDLSAAANKFFHYVGHPERVAFRGEMGTGKTTLIKALCAKLGADQAVSPTFSLVNEYRGTKGQLIYHLDLYRLESIEEAYDMGIEEYLDANGAWCFIEWPEVIEELLPWDTIRGRVDFDEQGKRRLRLFKQLRPDWMY